MATQVVVGGLITSYFCCTASARRHQVESSTTIMETDRTLRSMLSRGHSAPVVFVHATADSRFVYSASADGLICKWNTTTGDCLASFRGPSTRALSVAAFTHKDDYMFAGYGDGTTFAHGERALVAWWLPTPQHHPSRVVSSALYHPADAGSDIAKARLQRAFIGEQVDIPMHFPLGVSALVYLVYNPTREGTPAAVITPTGAHVAPPSIVPVLVYQDEDNTDESSSSAIHDEDARARAPGRAAGAQPPSRGTAAGKRARRRDGSSSLGSSSDSGDSSDSDSSTSSTTEPHGPPPERLLDCLLLGTISGSLILVEPFTARRVRSFVGHRMEVTAIAVQNRTVVSTSLDFSVRVWDLYTGQQHFEAAITARPICMATQFRSASAAGIQSVFIGGTNGCIEVLSGPRLDRRSYLYGHHPSMHITALRLTGRAGMISASADSTIKEWDTVKRACARTYSAHDGPVLAIAAEGTSVFTGSEDTSVARFDRSGGIRFVVEARARYAHLSFTSLSLPIIDVIMMTLQLLSFPLSRTFPWGSQVTVFQRAVEYSSLTLSFKLRPAWYALKFYLSALLMSLAVLVNVTDTYGGIRKILADLTLKRLGANSLAVTALKKRYKRLATFNWLFVWFTCTVILLPLTKNMFEVFQCSYVAVDGETQLRWDPDPGVRCYRGTHLASSVLAVIILPPYVLFGLRLSVCSGDLDLISRGESTAGLKQRLRQLFGESWFHVEHVDGYAGMFTRDPFKSQPYNFANAIMKLTLSLITIVARKAQITLAVIYLLLSLASVLLQLRWRPYFFPRMNLVFLVCKILVVYICVLTVVIVSVRRQRELWGGLMVYIGGSVVVAVSWLIGTARQAKMNQQEQSELLENITRARFEEQAAREPQSLSARARMYHH